MLFKEWANIWLEDYKRNTVKANTFKQTYQDTFRLYLMPRFGDMQLEEVSKRVIMKLLGELSTKYSQTVLSKIGICLNGLFSSAIDEGFLTVNPAANIRIKSFVPKVQKATYSKRDAELLFEYAAGHCFGLGVCIMLEIGLRCSEMLGLQWGDVDFSNRWLYINRTSVDFEGKPLVSTPKSESSRRVLPITDRIISVLRSHKSALKDYIVPSPSGKAYTPANYTKNRYNVFFKDCERDTGLKRLSPHELRHTCGTLLYADSGDIYAVSKFLGHSSVNITSKLYVHSSPEMLRERLWRK